MYTFLESIKPLKIHSSRNRNSESLIAIYIYTHRISFVKYYYNEKNKLVGLQMILPNSQGNNSTDI